MRFEAAWHNGFYKPLKRVVVPMTVNRKSIDVGGQRVETLVFIQKSHQGVKKNLTFLMDVQSYG